MHIYTMNKIATHISPGTYKPTLLTRCAITILVAFFVIIPPGKSQSIAGVMDNAGQKNRKESKFLLPVKEESLAHEDIQLGESFILVNDNIERLKEKKGKVSVGCALVITDKKGKVIQEVTDSYAGNDTFNKEDLQYMHCIINTGKPMEWGETYSVVITFWDKYSSAKFINKLTVRIMMDDR